MSTTHSHVQTKIMKMHLEIANTKINFGNPLENNKNKKFKSRNPPTKLQIQKFMAKKLHQKSQIQKLTRKTRIFVSVFLN